MALDSIGFSPATPYPQLLAALRETMAAVPPTSSSPGLGRDVYIPSNPPPVAIPPAPALDAATRYQQLHDLMQQLAPPPVAVPPQQPAGVPQAPQPQAPQPAPQPPAPEPQAPSRTSTVGSGDSLWAIAARELGAGSRWREIYDLNRDQLSDPDRIFPGQVLRLPGGAAPDVPAAPQEPQAHAGDFPEGVAQQAAKLIASGYRYPPNLTTQYYHSPDKVGCCADFVCDSNHQAGFDLNGVMAKLGMNPHYCPSMIQYFKQHQQFIKGEKGAQVGDTVFFDWDGDGTSDHVAVVAAVDGEGRPTRIAESYDFNEVARERAMGDSLGCVMGYGRVVNR